MWLKTQSFKHVAEISGNDPPGASATAAFVVDLVVAVVVVVAIVVLVAVVAVVVVASLTSLRFITLEFAFQQAPPHPAYQSQTEFKPCQI